MKTIGIPSLAVASVGLVLAAGALGLVGGTRFTEAQSAMEMGLDMEITGNTATTLGPIEYCYEIPWSDEPFDGVADWTIDVYVRGDTQAPLAYDAWVTYDNEKVDVLQGTLTDPLIKLPGALDLSGYHEGQAAFGGIYLGPPYDGVSGDGTLVRTGIDIGASGLVTFGFSKGAYVSHPGSLDHPVTTHIGMLAINSTCPAGGETATVGGRAGISDGGSDTPAKSTDGSSARTYRALAGAAAAGAIVVATGAWYARRRWLR